MRTRLKSVRKAPLGASVVAVAMVALFLTGGSALFAGSPSPGIGGPGDGTASHHTGDGPQATRLVPSTRPLTPGELAAFRRAISDIAPDSVPMAHGRTAFDGERWQLITWKNKANERCYGVGVPGEGYARTCVTADSALAERAIHFGRGARERDGRWHAVWIDGLAAPHVRSLTVVAANCGRYTIEPDATGAFFHLIPGADAVSGDWPIRVQARDGAGAVLSTARLPVTTPDANAPLAADQPTCP